MDPGKIGLEACDSRQIGVRGLWVLLSPLPKADQATGSLSEKKNIPHIYYMINLVEVKGCYLHCRCSPEERRVALGLVRGHVDGGEHAEHQEKHFTM